jgi:hypothetical protein
MTVAGPTDHPAEDLRAGDHRAGDHRAARRPWVDAVLVGCPPAPVVLVLGGFLTSPPVYLPFLRRLREHGAADAMVARVWTMDWLLAARHGLGPILTRSGRALLEASARSEVLSLGAPVLVVGHSAGGMSARLLTLPVPFAGRRLNGSSRIGAIVTLGTPHVVSDEGRLGHRVAVEAATFADREIPGPWFAPRIGYLAVASRRVVGRPRGSTGERRAWGLYRGVLLEPGASETAGDGLIPIGSAILPGAPSIVLDDAAHGQFPGREWYGSERLFERWWPVALDAWRSALAARAGAWTDDSSLGSAPDGIVPRPLG